MNTARCRGCNRPIVWAEGLNGQRIPIDTAAPVYTLSEDGDRVLAHRVAAPAGVNHFVTCSEADQFSKGGKKS